MAFVSGGFYLSVTLMDSGANQTTKTYELQAADETEAAAAVTAILSALAGVTSAEITTYQWYEKMVENNVAYPSTGVQIEDMALLEFTIDGNPTKKATHTIPAPNPSIFTAATGPGANVLDTADSAVVAYEALFVPSTGSAFISDGELADIIVQGRRIHRKSRRG